MAWQSAKCLPYVISDPRVAVLGCRLRGPGSVGNLPQRLDRGWCDLSGGSVAPWETEVESLLLHGFHGCVCQLSPVRVPFAQDEKGLRGHK